MPQCCSIFCANTALARSVLNTGRTALQARQGAATLRGLSWRGEQGDLRITSVSKCATFVLRWYCSRACRKWRNLRGAYDAPTALARKCNYISSCWRSRLAHSSRNVWADGLNLVFARRGSCRKHHAPLIPNRSMDLPGRSSREGDILASSSGLVIYSTKI